jgi:UDP-N-acetylmuramyl tripeptide synthase
VTLAVDPSALEQMAAGHKVALVSGTNGKTTTTRLLAAALSTRGPVETNAAGSNLLPGLVGALSYERPGAVVALEVDEGLLSDAAAAVTPDVVVLLNLSRDQLDRIGEVRLHALSWRRMLDSQPTTTVVANVDDPLVVWAAEGASSKVWVGTGQRWREDAAACPACGNRIRWGPAENGQAPDWSCSSCSLRRPKPELWLEGRDLVLLDGQRLPVNLQLPGWCNLANAAMATGGVVALGQDPAWAVQAMARVGTVAGRYERVTVDGVRVRLLLAKNPAGWAEALELIRPAPLPVIIGINARVADGHDPSWLWDVPFEKLRGRHVVATGERGRDLAVRLRYADVDHTYVDDYREAVRVAGGPEVDLAANYTSFQDARIALRG